MIEMRVVHVVRSLDFGGAEKLVLQLAARQRVAGGVEARLACLKEGGRLEEEARALELPVTVTGLGKVRYISGIMRLRRHFAEVAPDIVHTHNFLSHVHAAPAARMLGIPVVHTKHGRAVTSFRWSPRLRRFLYRLADPIVVVSRETGDIFVERSGVERERIRVVYNGIDVERYKGAGSRRAQEDGRGGRPGREIVFGCVSRLDPVKDHATILRAFASVEAEKGGCVLLVVGDGPERDNIEDMIEGYSLGGRVIMPGYSDDVPGQIASMDVFLQPSLDEGLSLTLLEAAASGVPVIATPVGGTPEVIEDGSSGTFIEPGDWQGLAEAMKRFIEDPAPFERMALRAQETVERTFSLESMEARYRSLYTEAIKKRGK